MGGIITVLVLREVLPFIRRNGANGYQRHIKDLWRWHQPDPETGRFKWYARDDAIIKAIRESNQEVVKELYALRRVFEERPCIAREVMKQNEKTSEGERR